MDLSHFSLPAYGDCRACHPADRKPPPKDWAGKYNGAFLDVLDFLAYLWENANLNPFSREYWEELRAGFDEAWGQMIFGRPFAGDEEIRLTWEAFAEELNRRGTRTNEWIGRIYEGLQEGAEAIAEEITKIIRDVQAAAEGDTHYESGMFKFNYEMARRGYSDDEINRMMADKAIDLAKDAIRSAAESIFENVVVKGGHAVENIVKGLASGDPDMIGDGLQAISEIAAELAVALTVEKIFSLTREKFNDSMDRLWKDDRGAVPPGPGGKPKPEAPGPSGKLPKYPDDIPAVKGDVADASFAQKRPSTGEKEFSPDGKKKYSEIVGRDIKTIDDLADALKKGDVKPSQLPVDYVSIEGEKVIINTRTSEALIKAGIPQSQWYGRNVTGVEIPNYYPQGTTFDQRAREQMKGNPDRMKGRE